MLPFCPLFFFFFNDTAPTEIYTLPLHDALPICGQRGRRTAGARCRQPQHRLRHAVLRALPHQRALQQRARDPGPGLTEPADRKSTRLNSSHLVISYAVFCLKKKKKNNTTNCSTLHSTQFSYHTVLAGIATYW